MRYNIAVSGVGGLGILTLGRLFCRAAIFAGKNAIMSEVHGLAQRYGAVFVHVRISDGELLAPTIPQGRADLLVALEPVEGLRITNVVGPRTTVIMNANMIPPPTVSIGVEKYPSLDSIVDGLSAKARKVYVYNALSIAEKYGDPRLQNTVLLGMASELPEMPIPSGAFVEALKQEFGRRPKVLEMNLRAFEEGKKIMSRLISTT